MSFKRLFLVSLSAILFISFFSCNVTEEKTNDSFKWNYVKRVYKDSMWVIESSEAYKVDEYYTYKDTSSLHIVGYTTSDDSIFLTVKNNIKDPSDKSLSEHLTVGEYFDDKNNYNFDMKFFRKGTELSILPSTGKLKIKYLNSRIVFNFSSSLNNGFGIEDGLGDNLNVYLPKDTTTIE